MNKIEESEILGRLKTFNNWKYFNGQIEKEFEFKDFKSALIFVNNVGNEAESMDHHPNIFLHDWNKVKISVSTHSAGGITDNDFNLAAKIEEVK